MARAARRERSTAEQRLSIGQFAPKTVTWQGGVIFFGVFSPRALVFSIRGGVPSAVTQLRA